MSKFVLLFIIAILVSSCENPSPEGENIKSILMNESFAPLTYEKIQEKGVIRVGVVFNPTSFFIYRGELMGFEYDLISKFAKDNDLRLRLIIKESKKELIKELVNGKIDIVASGVINTKKMAQKIAFPHYYTTSRQVLIQKKSKTGVNNHVELIGKIINVAKDSPYYNRLKNLSEEIGGDIVLDTTINQSSEKLIELVADGSIEYTVSEERVAEVNRKYYDNLDISLPISFPQKLSWAVNLKSPELKNIVDEWVKKEKKKGTIQRSYVKYFANRHLYNKRLNSEYMIYKLKNEFKISQYDSLLKFHAKTVGWDWKLLSSMMYEESKFERTARSWAGALGLFQLMPKTAKGFGGKNMYDPEDNIKTAMAFIKDLQRQWEFIEDEDERTKFIIASYNAGSGHVHDARRLAKRYGHHGEIWDDNTEIYIKKLMESRYYLDRVVRYGYCRGSETHNYVERIMKRYEKYKSMTIDNTILDSSGKNL